jgi:hypothetical protein
MYFPEPDQRPPDPSASPELITQLKPTAVVPVVDRTKAVPTPGARIATVIQWMHGASRPG